MQLERSNAAGFSLIELLITISIMLIMAAIAIPTLLNAVRQYKIQSAATSISGAIQGTRMQAMSRGLPYKLTFSSAASTYQASYCSACVSGSAVAYDTTLNAIPFDAPHQSTLSADMTYYLHPNGAIQKTDGTTDCSSTADTSRTMTLTYFTYTKTIIVRCYGKVTIQ